MKTDQIINQGDALDYLRSIESQSVDFILTDPPYGVLKKEEWDQGLTREEKQQFIIEANRVLTGGIFIFAAVQDIPGYNNLLHGEGFLHIRTGVWLKTVATWNSHPYPSNSLEYWIFADKIPGWKGRKTLLPFYIASPTARPLPFEDKLHPTRKPISLLRTIIHNHTCENSIILDPFAGSGSTGVAALLEKRKTLLNERDSVFIKMIEKNLTNYQQFSGREKLAEYMAKEKTAEGQVSDAKAKTSGAAKSRQSFTSEQFGSSSQERSERASVANPITSSTADVATPIPASKDFIGAITELIAESIRPLIFPSNDPIKFSVAHGGVVINLSII